MKGHVYKRGQTYTYVLDAGRDPGTGARRQKSKGGFRTKRDAEAALNEALSRATRGELTTATKQTVAEVLEDWLAASEPSLRISTFDRYQRDVRLHIIPKIGAVRLADLTPAHVRALYRGLLDGDGEIRGPLSPTSVRHTAMVLHRALGDAVVLGLVRQNVTEMVKPPKKVHHEMTTWTTDQLQQFLEATKPHRLHAAFVLAATTGMRQGEIAALRWTDLNLDSEYPQVSVRRTVVRAGRIEDFAAPKTARGSRSVPLGPRTVEILARLAATQRRELDRLRDLALPVQGEGFVFTTPHGGVVKTYTLRNQFERLVAQSGVPRIRFHDLRHTFATRSLEQGTNAKTISDLLGHASVAFTLSTYAHAIPAMEQAAVRSFEAQLMR
ncbi:MAG TPA: site-specific integrase [Acidimicrobiia bacterium]|jgi:integrase